jgi:hypothetical protein
VLTHHKIGPYEFLATRIEAEKIQAIVAETKSNFEKINADEKNLR